MIRLLQSRKTRSFLRGMGSVLEIMPPYYAIDFVRDHKTVQDALAEDWRRVGDSIRESMNMVAESHGK